jgi:tellurite resistance protein
MPIDEIAVPDGWTPHHSLAYVLIATATVDSEVDAHEAEEILGRLSDWRDLGTDANDTLQLAYDYFVEVYDARGEEYLVVVEEHVNQLSETLDEAGKEQALRDIASIIAADGVLDAAEHAFFLAVADQWGISPELLAEE